MFVLVGRLSPCGLLAVEFAEHRNQRGTGRHWFECAPIEDVNLTAGACLLRVLLKRGFEDGRTEEHAGQTERVHLVCETFRRNPRRAHELEWTSRAASFGEHHALEH